MKARNRQPALSLRGFYHATWWALAGLTSLIAYVSELGPRPLVGVAFLLASASLLPFARRVPVRLPRLFNLLFLAFCVVIGFFRYRADGDILYGIGCVLIGLWPLALWYRELNNNNWLALVEVFLVSLVSLVLGEESIEFFLFLCIAIAFVFNLNSSYLYFHVGAVEAAQAKMPRRYFWMFSYSAGVGFLIALAIFLLLPRSIQWVNPFGLRQKTKSLGFGSDVTLDGKNIGDNPSLALRVESKDSRWLSINGPTLYFRGKTVENFDGMRWQSIAPERLRLRDTKPLRFQRTPIDRMLFLKIYREASPNDSVLYPGMLVEVLGPPSFRDSLRYDRHGNLFRYRPEAAIYSYEIAVTLPPASADIFSVTVSALNKSLRDDSDELPGRAAYLQVPKNVSDKPFFRNWVKGLALDPRHADLRQVIGTLNREFKTKYKATYQHDIPSTGAFAYFLSRGHEGHCEYFATATALLFRTLGIPARLVLGYRGGDFNTLAKVLEVRDSSAHAWIEYYLPGRGWIPYDPTPVGGFRIFPSTFADYWQLTVSAVNFWFVRYVVGYNGETQTRLATKVMSFKPSNAGGMKFSWVWLRSPLLWIALLGLGLRFLWRRSRRGERNRPVLPSYYRGFSDLLRRCGFERERSETYHGFHLRLIAAGFDAALTQAIDHALHRDLYSRSPLSASERRDLHRRLRQRA